MAGNGRAEEPVTIRRIQLQTKTHTGKCGFLFVVSGGAATVEHGRRPEQMG